MENIGARRLHTVVEKMLEDLSFSAHEHTGKKVVIDAKFVRERLTELSERRGPEQVHPVKVVGLGPGVLYFALGQ